MLHQRHRFWQIIKIALEVCPITVLHTFNVYYCQFVCNHERRNVLFIIVILDDNCHFSLSKDGKYLIYGFLTALKFLKDLSKFRSVSYERLIIRLEMISPQIKSSWPGSDPESLQLYKLGQMIRQLLSDSPFEAIG